MKKVASSYKNGMVERIDRIKSRYQAERGELLKEQDDDIHRFTQHLKSTRLDVENMGDERQSAMTEVESSFSDRKLLYDDAIGNLHTLDRMLRQATNRGASEL